MARRRSPSARRKSISAANRFRPLALDAFAPDCVDQIYLIAASGWSDAEIARVCGVSASKLRRWRVLYPDLDKAILEGRLAPDMHVLQAAYRRAVGYDIPHVVKTETETPEGVTTAVRTEMVHIPPDPASQRFWLQNRAGDRWKDRRVEEKVVTHELGERLARALERAGGVRSLPPIEAIDVTPDGDTAEDSPQGTVQRADPAGSVD